MSLPHRTFRRAITVAAAAALAVLCAVEHPGAQSASPSAAPCDIRTTERIVAIGDVHGAHDRFVAILRTAGLLDNRDRWIGGRAVLVQTGDVLDRGPDSRKTLDLLRRLERDAPRAGGQVYALLGNHEVMRMIGDWRYISAQEDVAFRNGDSTALRDQAFEPSVANAERTARAEKRTFNRDAYRELFFKELPLGRIEMSQAFAQDGEYGRWLRTHPAFVKINGIVFVHGGISPEAASLGCQGINAAVAKDLTVVNPSPKEGAEMFSSGETGPLWYRGLAEEPEATFAPRLEEILRTLDARAIVVGHSVARTFRISTRFEGRVLQIDTGMLGGTFYPGGGASALEIQGNELTAIYPDRRERLVTPALGSGVATR